MPRTDKHSSSANLFIAVYQDERSLLLPYNTMRPVREGYWQLRFYQELCLQDKRDIISMKSLEIKSKLIVFFKNPYTRKRIKRVISRLLIFFPIQKNKVIFDNFNGCGYGGNPKYIAEELRRRKGFEIVWLVKNHNAASSVPSDITSVNKYSISALLAIATSKVWVSNIRYGKLLNKRKNQVYLQTWHGSFSIKKVEKDVERKRKIMRL